MKYLITGGFGMVGMALRELMPEAGYFSSKQIDLRDRDSTFKFFNSVKPKFVIHLAARVGGIKANSESIADFYSDNIRINTNVLDAAASAGVTKLVSLLSTCVYPDHTGEKPDYYFFPLKEADIHSGEPHSSNFGYAYAKRMLDVHSRALRQQRGCNFVTIVPNNLFGPHDNFDYTSSHVIPAIIRKMYEAKRDSKMVSLWGDGSQLREFTFAPDLANIIRFILSNYDEPTPINVGCTTEVAIKHVAETIAANIGYDGPIYWDNSEPAGQHRKPSDTCKLESIGWGQELYTPFETAIARTCQWFVSNYPRVRGVLI